MDKRVADIYDVVALLLILVICFATGVTAVVRDYHEVKNYEADYKDKTADSKYSPTVKIYGKYDGKLTKSELFLMSTIQDPGDTSTDAIEYRHVNSITKDPMTGENVYKFDTYDEHITAGYKEEWDSVVSKMNDLLEGEKAEKGGYIWKYDPEKNMFTFTQVTKEIKDLEED